MKNFQPNGKCGNCNWFRHSIKDADDNVITPANCKKGNNPKICPAEDFMPRIKKKAKRRNKPWQKELGRHLERKHQLEKRI